jgi:hypothetical protein
MQARATRRLGAALLLTTLAGPLHGQEVIVNARAALRAGQPAEKRPAVLFRKRADNLVQPLLVTDDTRSAEARLSELGQAIARLDEAARRSATVKIALVVETAEGIQLVRPFDRAQALATIMNGSRPDTSQVRLLAKTAIGDADRDQSQPAARIEEFLRGVDLAGRAQLERLGDAALSVVRPEQYRQDVVAAVAADLRKITDQMGSGYGGKVEGLEQPIEWIQLDELELGLYIPYQLTVER